MENTKDKNLTAQGFDESNEYSAPKKNKDVTEQDPASKSSNESEPYDEEPVEDTTEVIPEEKEGDNTNEDNSFVESDDYLNDDDRDIADETDDTLKPKKSEDAIDVMNRGEQRNRNVQEEEPK